MGKRYNKYGNKKTGKHASKKEAKRAFELEMLAKGGYIEHLQEQVKFELLPSQKEMQPILQKNGKHKMLERTVERPVAYIADFVYFENGDLIVEDTKGFRTPDYVIKRKLMLYIHGIKIRET